MIARSAGVSGAALLRMSDGTTILPTSWSIAPMRIQNSVLIVEAHGLCHGAGVIGDALAVAERVAILRFDRLTPLPNDVEESTLEPVDATTDVGDVTLHAKLREEAMRRVE